MKLLVVAATRHEVEPFIHETSGHPDIHVLITGVGMVATAYALGNHLAKNRYDALINVGIAGSFQSELPLGSVVRVINDCFSELGAEDHQHFLSIDDMGFGTASFKDNTGLFDHLPSVSALEKVSSITVNTVHGNEASIERIKRRLNPQIESMEGAAVFYVAKQLNFPCLQVRALSNRVEPRNKSAWKIGLAIENLNRWLAECTADLFVEKDQ